MGRGEETGELVRMLSPTFRVTLFISPLPFSEGSLSVHCLRGLDQVMQGPVISSFGADWANFSSAKSRGSFLLTALPQRGASRPPSMIVWRDGAALDPRGGRGTCGLRYHMGPLKLGEEPDEWREAGEGIST